MDSGQQPAGMTQLQAIQSVIPAVFWVGIQTYITTY